MILYLLTTTLCVFMSLVFVSADYQCLCVFDNHVHPIYQEPNVTSYVIGFIPPNQCKYYLYPVDKEFGAIMIFHQIGFIHMNSPGMKQTCEGQPSPDDILTTSKPLTHSTTPITTPTTSPTTTPSTTPTTTSPTTSTTPTKTLSTTLTTTLSTTPTTAPSSTPTTTLSTTPTTAPSTTPTTTPPTTATTTSPTTSTTPTTTPSTTPTTTPSTTPTTTLLASSTTSPVSLTTAVIARSPKPTYDPIKTPEGQIEICPDYVKNTDVNRNDGFLGQYGEFCYELVNKSTQYVNAERHCAIVSSGHLVHVLNQDEQDFLVRFLNKHHHVSAVWLGLTDSETSNEGTWRWSSGAPYKYNNFQGEYAQHTSHTHQLNDCVVLKQGGEWTDLPCGVAFVLGTGFGESHPYICQYNVSSSLPSIIQTFPDVIVG